MNLPLKLDQDKDRSADFVMVVNIPLPPATVTCR